jgi:hypothetical protein
MPLETEIVGAMQDRMRNLEDDFKLNIECLDCMDLENNLIFTTQIKKNEIICQGGAKCFNCGAPLIEILCHLLNDGKARFKINGILVIRS